MFSFFSLTEKIAWSWFLFWIGGSILAFAFGMMSDGKSAVFDFYSCTGCVSLSSGQKDPTPLTYVYWVITLLMFPLLSRQHGGDS